MDKNHRFPSSLASKSSESNRTKSGRAPTLTVRGTVANKTSWLRRSADTKWKRLRSSGERTQITRWSPLSLKTWSSLIKKHGSRAIGRTPRLYQTRRKRNLTLGISTPLTSTTQVNNRMSPIRGITVKGETMKETLPIILRLLLPTWAGKSSAKHFLVELWLLLTWTLKISKQKECKEWVRGITTTLGKWTLTAPRWRSKSSWLLMTTRWTSSLSRKCSKKCPW